MTTWPETKRLDTAEQFEQATWLRTTPEVWRPINTTPAKLAELKEQTSSLPESEREARTRAFIEANKASEAPSEAPAQVVAVAATAGIGAEIGSVIKDAGKEAVAELQKPGFWKDQAKPFIKDIVEGLVEAKKEPWVMSTLAGFALRIIMKFSFFRNMLTPEQLKDLGIEATSGSWGGGGSVEAPKPDDWAKPPVKLKEAVENELSNQAYRLTGMLLVRGMSKPTYSTVLGAAWDGVGDKSWKEDELKRRDETDMSAVNILMNAEVRKKSYTEIIQLWKAGIDQLAWSGTDTNLRNASATLVIDMLNKNKSTFSAVFSDTPNWDKMPLDELMKKLYLEKWLRHAESFTQKLQSINFSDMADLPSDIFLWAKFDADGNLQGDGIFASRYQSLKSQWLTPGLLAKLHTDNNTANLPVAHAINPIIGSWINWTERSFVEKMTDPNKFLWVFITSLKEKFGYSDAMIAYMRADKLKMKDLFDLYVITGWEPNIEKLNIWEKSLLTAKLQAYFFTNSADIYASYIKDIYDKSDTYPLVNQAFTLISDTANKSVYELAKAVSKIAWQWVNVVMWWLGITSPEWKILASSGILAWVLTLAVQMAPIGRFAGVVMKILLALWLVGISVAQATSSSKN